MLIVRYVHVHLTPKFSIVGVCTREEGSVNYTFSFKHVKFRGGVCALGQQLPNDRVHRSKCSLSGALGNCQKSENVAVAF